MSRLTGEALRRQKAREAVNALVRKGDLPHPRDSFCFGCRGEASQYDHHRGYEGPAVFDVQPVCVPCHVKRSVARGEVRGRASRSLLMPPTVSEARAELARRFSALLAAKGVSQSSLARALGILPSAVCHWCTGRAEPSASNLARAVAALGSSMAELFGTEAA